MTSECKDCLGTGVHEGEICNCQSQTISVSQGVPTATATLYAPLTEGLTLKQAILHRQQAQSSLAAKQVVILKILHWPKLSLQPRVQDRDFRCWLEEGEPVCYNIPPGILKSNDLPEAWKMNIGELIKPEWSVVEVKETPDTNWPQL